MKRIAALPAALALVCVSATVALAAAPTATTGSATSVNNNSATLNGTVNPNGDTTSTYAFQYGTTSSYGRQTAFAPVPNSSSSTPQSVAASVSNLTPGTTYHYRLIVRYGPAPGNVVVGADATFSTTGTAPSAVTAPTVQTKPATNTAPNAATVNGTVNPHGSGVKVYFEFGLSQFYGTQTTPASVPAGNSTRPVSARLTGLQANQTYHFRIVAQDANGRTVVGADMTFRTVPSNTPALRNVSIRPNAFRTTGRHAGTTVRYHDSLAARTTFTVERIVDGVVRNGRCVAAHGSTGHARRCTRFVFVGRFTHSDRAGNNRVHFSGILNGRRLSVGRYRLTLQARNSNGTSPRKRARFRVIR